MLEFIRTLTAREYSFQNEQEGEMEPKKFFYFILVSVGELIEKTFLPRGIIGLLYRKK